MKQTGIARIASAAAGGPSLTQEWSANELVGTSPAFQWVLRQVETVAPTNTKVLVEGETGTGKELIAQAIHSLSARRDGPCVKVNCAAIPTGLIESELFGHERGAFTGAFSPKMGRFQLANRGTLFLDEIGDLPLELQPKLLRALQEREFERLGSTQTVRVDVRIVAATNQDLARLVQERRFRADLYYRLNVFPISLPPLRARVEDLPALVHHLVRKFCRQVGKQIENVPTEVMEALKIHDWPGNIRELENFIERAVILSTGPDLRPRLSELSWARKPETYSATNRTLAEAERDLILDVLHETHGVLGGADGAAVRLGLPRTTLVYEIRRLGIGSAANGRGSHRRLKTLASAASLVGTRQSPREPEENPEIETALV
jgi:formate hydrogenlyase transcriptional activator